MSDKDTIYREDVLRIIDRKTVRGKLQVAREVLKLPSAQPERKRGRWLHVEPEPEVMLGWMPWYCSECGVGVGKHQTAFCPNCGADMRGKRNE